MKKLNTPKIKLNKATPTEIVKEKLTKNATAINVMQLMKLLQGVIVAIQKN